MEHPCLRQSPVSLEITVSRRCVPPLRITYRLPHPKTSARPDDEDRTVTANSYRCAVVQHSTSCASIVAWLLAEVRSMCFRRHLSAQETSECCHLLIRFFVSMESVYVLGVGDSMCMLANVRICVNFFVDVSMRLLE